MSDIIATMIKSATPEELQAILMAIIARRLDFLARVDSYRETPAQVEALRAWDIYDHLIEWRMRKC